MVKKILLGLLPLLLLFVFSALRPVPIIAEEEALSTHAVVAGIYESGYQDITIQLEGNPQQFYINRGIEQGLRIDDLKRKLIGKEVTIKYPKYWTPLDWNNHHKHLSKIETEQEVIFSEFN